MAAQPCKECGARPKVAGRHRCATCALRAEPIDVQVQAAQRRLGMVPPELRKSRVHPSLWPPGQRWCAGCQSFRDLVDFGKNATQCRACVSGKNHAAMIERTYDLTRDQYDELLQLQGGRCAICRARPKSKRLAVDHDHGSGKVRGLLCGRCNHELLGSGWDSVNVLQAAVAYLQAPPATGTWTAPEQGPARPPRADLVPAGAPASPASGSAAQQPASPWDGFTCQREHYLPNGAVTEPGKRGVWKVWVSDAEDTSPPF